MGATHDWQADYAEYLSNLDKMRAERKAQNKAKSEKRAAAKAQEYQAQLDDAYSRPYDFLNVKRVEDLPNEVWRDVVGFEGFLKVSNLGRVKRTISAKYDYKILNYSPECLYKVRFTKRGRAYVLTHRRKLREFKKHWLAKLVAEAFIKRPPYKNRVIHLNHDIGDCRAENLAWVTDDERCAFWGQNPPKRKSKR